jgi:hypothetical protein
MINVTYCTDQKHACQSLFHEFDFGEENQLTARESTEIGRCLVSDSLTLGHARSMKAQADFRNSVLRRKSTKISDTHSFTLSSIMHAKPLAGQFRRNPFADNEVAHGLPQSDPLIYTLSLRHTYSPWAVLPYQE